MRRPCAVVLVAVLFATLFTPVAGAAPRDPFTGAWTAIDPLDQSTMRLAISAGTPHGYQITLFDDMATSACGGHPALARGIGTASGLSLDAPMDVWCLAPRSFAGAWSTVFTYDPATDTLWDSSEGVAWQRAGQS